MTTRLLAPFLFVTAVVVTTVVSTPSVRAQDGCVQNISTPRVPPSEAYPDAKRIGFVNTCGKSLVGLICVQDNLSLEWRSWYSEGRWVHPGKSLTAEIMFPDDYIGARTMACVEGTRDCSADASMTTRCSTPNQGG